MFKNMLSKQTIFFPYESETCINLILALATNYQVQAKSVVELSLNKYFKREYSILYRALDGYYAPRSEIEKREEKRAEARKNIRNFLINSSLELNQDVCSLFIDMTGNEKKHSHKTAGREYIHTGMMNGELN